MGCNWWCFKYHTSAFLKNISILSGIFFCIYYSPAMMLTAFIITWKYHGQLVWHGSIFQTPTIWQSNVQSMLLFFQLDLKYLAWLFCHHAYPLYLFDPWGFIYFAIFSFVCKLSFLLSCGSPIISHVILSMLSISMSSIPSIAGTSKNPHLTLLSCVLILLYTLLIVKYLIGCIFSMTELFLWCVTQVFCILETEHENHLTGIKLLSLQVSI